MRYVIMAALMILPSATARTQQDSAGRWLTYYELSGYRKTPRYAETVDYCKRMAKASPWVRYTSFGVSPQGRALPLVIVSKERAFDPPKAASTGKPIVLIQSGIHAGEIDGKDASLMLIRDIAIRKTCATLLDHAILLFVPIFNVDGHERFGPFNRINQNGPQEMGWRVTSQNLNLNRDYMKADAPEMRAMLALFSTWLPDLTVDCHVTDGIDMQYDVTYSMETAQDIDPELRSWITGTFLPTVLSKVEASGHRIFPYVTPRADDDPGTGLSEGVMLPRLSTGYAALQNRPSLLIETHMLKPYRDRVDATYQVLKAALETINGAPELLHTAVRHADQTTIRAGESYDPRKALPLRFGEGQGSERRKFLAIKFLTEPSDISGMSRRVYTGEPYEIDVPLFDETVVTDSVSIPLAYLIPEEWKFIPEIMKLHGVKMQVLVAPVTATVESYMFSNIRWNDAPYEGRQMATFKVNTITESRTYPAGTVLIPMNQRAAKVAMYLLEPRSPDSFAAWGFFNAIFEQKEYAEPYVMEEEARKMIAADPGLKKEFEQKLQLDSTFSKNPHARLNWFYLRSRWADPWLDKYPIGRVVSPVEFTTRQYR